MNGINKEMVLRFKAEQLISFVSLPSASEPSMDFDNSKLIYWQVKLDEGVGRGKWWCPSPPIPSPSLG